MSDATIPEQLAVWNRKKPVPPDLIKHVRAKLDENPRIPRLQVRCRMCGGMASVKHQYKWCRSCGDKMVPYLEATWRTLFSLSQGRDSRNDQRKTFDYLWSAVQMDFNVERLDARERDLCILWAVRQVLREEKLIDW